MNYQEALHRLQHPKNQKSKMLEHKLKLYAKGVPPNDLAMIALQYFSTDIITWLEDGRVVLNAGDWMKFDRFLPRGWKIRRHDLRHWPKHFAVTLETRSPDAPDGSFPYANGQAFTAKGRTDLCSTTAWQATQLIELTAGFVQQAVTALLSGKIHRYARNSYLEEQYIKALQEGGLEAEDITLEIINDKYESGREVFMNTFADRWCPTLYRPYVDLYWAENFEITRRPRTLKEKIRHLEARMSGSITEDGGQPARNSKEFHDIRKTLLASAESVVLERLGFEIFSRE